MKLHRWEDLKRRKGLPEGEDPEGVLISYEPLPDGSWQARLLWRRGDPLITTARSIVEARKLIRAALVDAVGDADAASLLENGAESLPLEADE